MPAALDVDREQVRMLALSLGVREAARKMGLPESTVQYWSMTGKWLAHLKPSTLEERRPVSMQPRSTVSTNPADALTSHLAENKRKTKTSLSNYLSRASGDLENVADPLSVTDAALQLATMASKVYPEDHQEAAVSLQFFNITQERAEIGQNEGPEHRIYDIPAHDEGDPMDDPAF